MVNMKYLKHLILALIIISSIILAVPVFADTGYNVTNNIITLSLNPGQSQTSTIAVTNESSTDPTDLNIEVDGLGQGTDGSTLALSTAQDTSPHSARTFTSINLSSIHLEPNASQDIQVTVTVPGGEAAGEYYACVYMYNPQPNSQDKVGMILASIVPVIITVPGFTSVTSGHISSVNVPQAYTGQTIEVDTTLQNTGNCRISSATDTVSLYNSSGSQLSQILVQLGSPSVLPTFSRTFQAYFTGQVNGNYSVKSVITTSAGTVIDSETASFSVVQSTTATTSSTTATSSTTTTTSSTTTASSTTTTITPITLTDVEDITTTPSTITPVPLITTIQPGTISTILTTPAAAQLSTSNNPTQTSDTNTATLMNNLANITSLPEADASSTSVFQFSNQSSLYADASAKDGVVINLSGGTGSGFISVIKYSSEPSTGVIFSSGIIEGGTGKPAIKFVDVQVQGYSQGAAVVAVQYSEDEVKDYDINSLFLSYFSDGKWHKAENIVISTDDKTVTGGIPTDSLGGTVIGLGGNPLNTSTDAVFTPTTAQVINQPGPGISWSLVGIIIVSTILIGGIIFVVIQSQRKNRSA